MRLAWVSTLSVVLGFVLFYAATPAQDLFLEIRGNRGEGTEFWFAFYVLVLLAWAFPVYISAR